MNARFAKSPHLGERRFLEYPQISADEWGTQADLAAKLLTPARIVGAIVLLATLAAGAVLFLR